MSKTATGRLECADGKNLTATFVIDGVDYPYTATVEPSLQPFSSNNVTLTYNSVSDLTAQRLYSGKIGTDDFTLTLGNGPVMTGPLNAPGINPASLVSGRGTW